MSPGGEPNDRLGPSPAEPEKGPLPKRARILIGAVAGGGALAVALAVLAFPISLDDDLMRRALVLVAVTAAAELVAIRLQHGDEGELITLYELAIVADLVLLPASLGIVVAVTGLGIALVIQRSAPVKAIYNVGQYSLGVVAAFAVFHALGEHPFSTDRGLLTLSLGLAAFAAVNLVTISAILAAMEDRPLGRIVREEGPLSVAMAIGNAAVGIVAVWLYLTRPVLLPFILGPAVALHLAFRGWIKEKELSRRMEDEKTKLERIVQHAGEGIVLADSRGRVVLWSPSMERITGVPEAEAQGKAVSFLLRGRGPHGEEPVEVEVLTAGGEWGWLHVQHGPALDPDGRLAFDVLLVNDVTRQREVERLKSDFIAIVSHELRTPLTPIKGHASLLLRRWADIPEERRTEGLRSIVERVDHMARLVEDLLLASRVTRDGERRFVEVNRQDFDMTRVLDKVMASFRISHPHREFHMDVPAGLVVSADPLRTEQVVAHLVSNAVKFSDDGTPIEVAITREAERIRIAVRDHGRGIPADRFEEIFERFKRLEDPLRMETGGAGLGLFIVRQLTLAMSGEVQVESTVGEGSTFTVWLPAGEGQAAAGPMSAARA